MKAPETILIEELEAQVNMEKILVERLRTLKPDEDTKIILDCITQVHTKIQLLRTIIW